MANLLSTSITGTLSTTGNTGIGTTNPIAKLEVYNGTSRFWHGGTSHYTEFNNSNEINTYASNGAISEMFLNWVSGGNVNIARSAIYAQSAGNVGIGTTSPENKLHVNSGGTNIAAKFESTDGTGGIMLADSTGNVELTTSGTNGFNIQPGGGSTVFRVEGGGNVGIGVTSPAFKLEVGTPAVVDGSDYAWSFDLTRANSTARGFHIGLGADTTFPVVLGSHNADMAFGHTYGTDANGNPAFYETMRIKHVDQAAGNVGIGTTAPSSRLHVVGDILASASSGNRSVVLTTNNANAALNTIAGTGAELATDGTNQNIAFRTGASTRMYIKSDGNVGIGTTAPGTKLDVAGDAKFGGTSNYNSITINNNSNTGGGGIIIQRSGVNNAYIGALGWYQGTSNSGAVIGTDNSSYPIVFYTNVERMRITGSGNVLIGTTTDSGIKLDVNGNGRFSGGAVYLGDYTGNPELILQAAGNSFSKINFYDNNNTEGVYIRSDGQQYGGTMTFGARWDDDEPKVVFKMYQSSAGASYDVRVGVNTSSPASIMHLAGGDGQLIIQKNNFVSIHQEQAWATNLLFGAYHNGTNQVYGATGRGAFKIVALHDSDVSPQYIAFYGANAGTAGQDITWNTVGFVQDEDGNVGIGTTSPSYRFHVVSPTAAGDYVAYIQNSGGGNGLKIYNNDWDVSDYLMYVSNRGGYVLAVDGNARLGLGTDSPAYRIDSFAPSGTDGFIRSIGGAGGTKGGFICGNNDGTKDYVKFFFDNSNNNTYLFQYYPAGSIIFGLNGSEKLRIANDGKVGIGNSSPSEILDVSGSIKASDSMYAPYILVNNHSDNTKGYRIHNTSGSNVSAMFTNSSNHLVIGAGALARINLNKDVHINGVSLGVGSIEPSGTAGRIDASNDIVAFNSSDERLKENITPIENALEKVKSLTGVEFDWKPEHKDAHGHEGHDTGVIAQQVQDVMPTAVRTNDTGFLAVRYEKLIGLLVEGMKEQQTQIDELKAKLDGLTK